MIDEGLVDEVGQVLELILSNTPSLHYSNLSSMQAIGYKEIAMYLNGKISIEEAIRLVKKRTKMYAKRQFTWFKKEEGIRWIDVTGIYEPYLIFQKLIKYVSA
jgi:tRNA dimethylallyltransferase